MGNTYKSKLFFYLGYLGMWICWSRFSTNLISKSICECAPGINNLTTGKFQDLEVKKAWQNVLVATEVICWFFVGEVIGRRSLIGYNVWWEQCGWFCRLYLLFVVLNQRRIQSHVLNNSLWAVCDPWKSATRDRLRCSVTFSDFTDNPWLYLVINLNFNVAVVNAAASSLSRKLFTFQYRGGVKIISLSQKMRRQFRRN